MGVSEGTVADFWGDLILLLYETTLYFTLKTTDISSKCLENVWGGIGGH